VITSDEFRELFLEFFRKRGHRIVPSSPVIPFDDPTLLFTNAGMNQFKDIFLGKERPEFKRAASVQKCIRASGKHNDLEDVGKDGKHHTFFEMLGNWSFGDYYKEDAIKWAWEFVTTVMGLPDNSLWVSIYKDDEESYKVWKNIIGVPENRIVRLGDIEAGDEENFWSMGDTGPCGPCSEIHFDYSPMVSSSFEEKSEAGQIVELWNLVFMEFNRLNDGSLEPLPAKNVDTGMGLERALAIIQGVDSNYKTDLFIPLFQYLEELSKTKPDTRDKLVAFRVICDHIRCLSFAIADGAVPSNEGRGYVLRRILRRATRFGRVLELRGPFLYRMVEPLVQKMGRAYPELEEKKDYIQKIIFNEEEQFLRTLDRGIELFEKTVAEIKARGEKVFPGETAFMLHDTYGFPLDLTELMAEEKGMSVDRAGFKKQMEEQRARARAGSKFAIETQNIKWVVLRENEKTVFTGYERLIEEKMFLVKYAIDNGTAFLVFDRSPFYAESGGQVGDTGIIESEGVRIRVSDVKKEGEFHVHIGKIEKGEIRDIPYKGIVDEERRKLIMANHTATHLLHYALRKILGNHAAQSGSLVADTHLRFDFNHYEPLKPEQIEELENTINDIIFSGRRVIVHSDVPIEKAKEMGAIALFGEKYGEKVRVVEVEGISKELCGGTHVSHTGQIGMFRIVREGSISAGIRRIEAVTSKVALDLFKSEGRILSEVLRSLNAGKEDVLSKIEEMKNRIQSLEREIKKLKKQKVFSAESSRKHYKAGMFDLEVLSLTGYSLEEMRNISDSIKAGLKKGVVFISSEKDGKVSFVLTATKEAVESGVNAGEILKKIAPECDGSGGGRAHLAQGGARSPEKIDRVVEKLKEILSSIK